MKIKELLSDESKWTKYATARNKEGNHVTIYDSNAVQWCVLGAMEKCYSNDFMNMYHKLKESFGKSICEWNDSSTYQEVMAKLNEVDI